MFAVVLCTTPAVDAQRISGTLVEERLVACVNIADVKSVFRWNDEVQSEAEALLVMKTRAGKVRDLIARIRELHSYEVPEVIALPVIDGLEEYLDWVRESV